MAIMCGVYTFRKATLVCQSSAMGTRPTNLAEGEACRTGDLIGLQGLLTDQSDVSIVTEGGVTLLMHAIIGAGE